MLQGEQPHCGFPEKNFSANVEKLARKVGFIHPPFFFFPFLMFSLCMPFKKKKKKFYLCMCFVILSMPACVTEFSSSIVCLQ